MLLTPDLGVQVGCEWHFLARCAIAFTIQDDPVVQLPEVKITIVVLSTLLPSLAKKNRET